MREQITELKDIFDSIICLAVEGPEFCTKLKLMDAIQKEAMKGYKLCKRHLSSPIHSDRVTPHFCEHCGRIEGVQAHFDDCPNKPPGR